MWEAAELGKERHKGKEEGEVCDEESSHTCPSPFAPPSLTHSHSHPLSLSLSLPFGIAPQKCGRRQLHKVRGVPTERS